MCNQSAARLGITHLLQQSLYCPTQRFALGFAFKENNRRQRIQQKPCFTFQPKVASKNEKVITGSQRQDTVVPFLLGKRCPGSELLRRVARQAERPAFGKQKATFRSESDGLFHVLYSQPALAPNYAVALDHAVRRELNTPVSPSAQTACGIGAWLDKGQNVGKRIHQFCTHAPIL